MIHTIRPATPRKTSANPVSKRYSLQFFFCFFNEIECKKGRTSNKQPLWISKDPCISEEKGNLIKWEGGGVFVHPVLRDWSLLLLGKMEVGREFQLLEVMETNVLANEVARHFSIITAKECEKMQGREKSLGPE